MSQVQNQRYHCLVGNLFHLFMPLTLAFNVPLWNQVGVHLQWSATVGIRVFVWCPLACVTSHIIALFVLPTKRTPTKSPSAESKKRKWQIKSYWIWVKHSSWGDVPACQLAAYSHSTLIVGKLNLLDLGKDCLALVAQELAFSAHYTCRSAWNYWLCFQWREGKIVPCLFLFLGQTALPR